MEMILKRLWYSQSLDTSSCGLVITLCADNNSEIVDHAIRATTAIHKNATPCRIDMQHSETITIVFNYFCLRILVDDLNF
jgi:hypothetical protein